MEENDMDVVDRSEDVDGSADPQKDTAGGAKRVLASGYTEGAVSERSCFCQTSKQTQFDFAEAVQVTVILVLRFRGEILHFSIF